MSRWRWTLVGLAVTAVYLVPVYWMVATSVKPLSEIFASPPTLLPIPPHVSSYTDVAFADADIGRGLLNTAIIAVGTTVLTLALAAPAAYGLARFSFRFLTPVLLLFLVVQMVPSVNLALPMFTIFSKLGLVNTYAGLIVANTSLALPLAIIVFVGAFIPIVGATVAGIVAALVALVTNDLVTALIVAAVVVLVNQVEGNLLAPIVLGKSLRLHELVILLALTIGTILGGIVGTFLAVPFAAVGWAVIKAWRDPDAARPERGFPS
jgi:multiple sugar transport system permease protein